MLDNLDLNLSLDKETYSKQIEELMRELRSLQKICWQEKIAVVVVLEGWAAAGKGSLLKKMTNYMDPRGFLVHPILVPSEQERQYPFLWRFWQKLPHQGSIGIFYHSWYIRLLEDRLFKRLDEHDLPLITRDINAFERQLADDGVIISKFWLHLGKKELKSRLEAYEEDKWQSWRVRKEDWQQAKKYDKYKSLAEDMLTYTSTGFAPWTLVEANDKRWARVKVLTQLVADISNGIEKKKIKDASVSASPPVTFLSSTEHNYLQEVDLTSSLEKDEYKQKLKSAQLELRKLQKKIFDRDKGVIVLFEGWDAAGKGGAIKRVTDILDPRSYEVHAFAAPNEEEASHHYLWRFWRRLPARQKIGIFDRTWYGRVLVERVEGFATPQEWQRAYQEINEFEAQLVTEDYIVIKFWLHIDKDEQLKRFNDRQNDPYKSYKLTEEDWRNREKWDLYATAVNQMVARTTTPQAQWTIVPGNNKYYARVFVLETIIKTLKNEL